MPNPSELAREDQEADVHREYTCPPLRDNGVHPLWAEVQELTARIRDLESQLATAETDRDVLRDELRLMSARIGKAFAPAQAS